MSDADTVFARAQAEIGSCAALRILVFELIDRQKIPNDGFDPTLPNCCEAAKVGCGEVDALT